MLVSVGNVHMSSRGCVFLTVCLEVMCVPLWWCTQSNTQGGMYECTAATFLPGRAYLSLPGTGMMAVIKAHSHREMRIAPCLLRLELIAIRELSLKMPK